MSYHNKLSINEYVKTSNCVIKLLFIIEKYMKYF